MVDTIYAVIFEGLIFRRWQPLKDFHDFISVSPPMEYILMKAKYGDENFMDSVKSL